MAAREGYDLLIHGKGGPTAPTDYRYEQFPWTRIEYFEQGAAVYPQDLHRLINEITRDNIWRESRGGRCDAPIEGTDLIWTLPEAYYEGSRRGFNEAPSETTGTCPGIRPPRPSSM